MKNTLCRLLVFCGFCTGTFASQSGSFKTEYTSRMGDLPGTPPYLREHPEGAQRMGVLTNFYRQAQVLGSWMKTGYYMETVPAYYLELGDFPYKKKSTAKEILFADRMSVSRFLGGWGIGFGGIKSIKEARSRDLVRRKEDGSTEYRWGGQMDYLRSYLDAGIDEVILSIDNIPWDLAENPKPAAFGQSQPQRDIKEWQTFFEAFLDEMGARYGADFMNRHVSFRAGTEFNRTHTYTGTYDTYIDWYDHAAQSVKKKFPGAKIGLCEIAGWMEPGADNVFFPDVVNHIISGTNRATGTTGGSLDFIANSSHAFPRWNDEGKLVGAIDPRERAWVNADLYRRLLGGRTELMAAMPVYVFQFGMLRSEVLDAQGKYLGTDEPGARGAAWQFIALMETWRQWPAIKGVGHWDTYEPFGKQLLMKGVGWMYNCLDYMQGRETFLLPVDGDTDGQGSFCKAYAFINQNSEKQYIMVAAFNPDRKITGPMSVKIRLPQSVCRFHTAKNARVRLCKLTEENSPYAAVRADLKEAGLLPEAYVQNPRLLAAPRYYAADNPGLKGRMDAVVLNNFGRYVETVKESFVLQPFGGQCTAAGDGAELGVGLEVPSLHLIELSTDGAGGPVSAP